MPTQEMPIKDTLSLQEMARQSGLSEHIPRYYERIGLLTPIPRDQSSGHRRYPAETVSAIESLSCLRGTGMSLKDIRTFLHLRQQGSLAAAEMKELFAAHLAVLTEEREQRKVRMKYLTGKVTYWKAVEDESEAKRIRLANHLLRPKMKRKKETP